MTVNELCQEIQVKRTEYYSRDLGPWARSNMVASDIGECQRESVLAITNWKDRPPFDAEVKARLERGNKIEDLAIAELATLGYKARIERTPFEIKSAKGQIVCRGRVDGFLATNGSEYPFECKSLNPNIFKQINEQADFDRYVFFRKYPKQLQTYLYANNLSEGFWILDDCLGHWKLIPCQLDYDRMEKVLQHLESVANHLEAKTLPDFHKDPSTCLKCWAMGRLCNPPFFSTSEGLQVIDDPELQSKLTERASLEESSDRYEELDKELKTLFKGRTNLVIGEWLIMGEEKTRTYKAQPAKEAKTISYWQTNIERVEK